MDQTKRTNQVGPGTAAGMPRILFFWGIAIGLLVASMPRVSFAQARLPDGEGKDLVERACVSCHGLDSVTKAQYSEDQWRNTVINMGTPLSDLEIEKVIKYLAKNFGGKSPVAPAGTHAKPSESAPQPAATTPGAAKAQPPPPVKFADKPLVPLAKIKNFTPVTQEMLLNPSPDDWLMFSRTYDSQRFSPLKQINRQNASQLRMVWQRGMEPGIHENIPIVHQGTMYVVNPGSVVQALDATNGDLIWEYRRKMPDDLRKYIAKAGRARTIAIYEDMIYFTSADGYVVALDARTGAVRWETQAQDYKSRAQHTAGPIVVNGKVITGRSCPAPETKRSGCFIAAHDAITGKEVWKFYTSAAPGEPGGDSWGDLPVDERMASPWGGPGSYDPVRKLVYWGIANPRPHTRMKRHHGNPDAIARSAPSDLYSNSTVALDVETGKLAWYYQHLPGDDWDSDYAHERILVRTPFNPDANAVKWINPRIPRGQERDTAVMVAEPGMIFALDRTNGEFLWATPFPYDTPYLHFGKVDVETGKTFLNSNLVFTKEGERHTVCYSNTRTYPPVAYHPGKNSLYVPYRQVCNDSVAKMANEEGDSRVEIPRPGSDPNTLNGLAKINLSTGQIERIYTSTVNGWHGAVLTTGGDLVFWGDQNRRFRAFDADNGKILWETVLGGAIENSTITYSVNGKQYIAVLSGDGSQKAPDNLAAIYVFALP